MDDSVYQVLTKLMFIAKKKVDIAPQQLETYYKKVMDKI